MVCQSGSCVPARTITTDYIELAAEDFYTNLMVPSGDSLLLGQPALPFTLTRVLLDGGSNITLAALARGPVGIAADSTTLYWTSYDSGASEGAISRIPIDGGTAETLATTGSFPTAIAVDTTRVYWIQQPADPTQLGPLQVMTSPLVGGVPIELARSSPATFDYDNPIKVYGIVLDDAGVYWTNTVDHTVEVVPTDGGPSRVVGTSDDGLRSSLAVSANHVFFVDSGGLQRVDLGSGQQVTVSPNAGGDEAVTADDTHVYFVVPDSYITYQLWRAPLDGGSPEILAGDMDTIWSVANDDRNVFLNIESCSSPGQILEIRKP